MASIQTMCCTPWERRSSKPTWATTTHRHGWILGPDRAGNLLEVIVLHFDDGREMAIHAMPMRSQYRAMLPRPPGK
jgi:hypothetical protein